jgi:D-xylose transport system substrate-binding protein
MTVYKAIKPEAGAAADLAVALANKKQPRTGLVNDKVNNGQKDVPSVLLKPVTVTKDNVVSTVVKDQFLKASDICSGQFAAACKAAGISGA